MAYTHLQTKTGTTPVQLKVSNLLLEWIDHNDLVLNRVVNYALQAELRAIQTGRHKSTPRMMQGTRAPRWSGIRHTAKSARIRRDLVDYIRLNYMNLNGTVNEAITNLQTLSDQWPNEHHGSEAPWLAHLRASTTSKQHRRAQNVDTKPGVSSALDDKPSLMGDHGATKQHAEPPQVHVRPIKVVHYLANPCKHAKFIGDFTKDCCGHCKYYQEDYTEGYKGFCSYDK